MLGSDAIGHAIDALGTALTGPRIDRGELEREREVILEGRSARAPTIRRARSRRACSPRPTRGHPYRRPVIGTADSVRRFGERDLVDFFRTYYVADNVTLVVAGDVDPAYVRRQVERRFGTMPGGRPPRRLGAEPEQTAPRAVAALRDVSEAYIAVGFHVPAARHFDVAALDVAAILLGESESARLPRRLRDEHDIVTSAYAQVHALRDPGLFVLSATARPRDAKKTVGALVDQALALVDDLAPDELDKARVAAEAGLVRQLETAQGRARAVGWNATMTGDPRFAHLYLDRVRSVRRHDVAAAVRRYLRRKALTSRRGAAESPSAGRRPHSRATPRPRCAPRSPVRPRRRTSSRNASCCRPGWS